MNSTSNSSNGSDISGNVELFRKTKKKERNLQQKDQDFHKDFLNIDGKSYLIEKNEMERKAGELIKKSIDSSILIESRRISVENSFYYWIQRKEVLKKPLNNDHPLASVINDQKLLFENDHRKHIGMKKLHNTKTKNATRKNRTDVNHPKKDSQFKISSNYAYVDRFGIPITMMNKANKKQDKKKFEKVILKKVRLTHIGYNQPPSKDDSSDNDSIQNVKKLALIRTPYFLIPTIKINKIRRKDRFRNEYLRNDRLNRINVLLYEKRNFNSEFKVFGDHKLNIEPSIIKSNALFPKQSKPKKDIVLLCSSIGSKYREVQQLNVSTKERK